jgi:hypothetical protein
MSLHRTVDGFFEKKAIKGQKTKQTLLHERRLNSSLRLLTRQTGRMFNLLRGERRDASVGHL